MIRKILFPLFLFLVSCNSPEPPASTVKPKPSAKPKPAAIKPAPNPWVIKNYTDANGNTTDRKYARFDAEGTYSDSTVLKGYLSVMIMLNKENAGILLRKLKKSNPVEKHTGAVRIKMKNSSGKELEMVSSRGWNKSGGILIEQNNNDYSQFRILMMQSEGVVSVEIRDETSTVYNFNLVATGFGDALSQL